MDYIPNYSPNHTHRYKTSRMKKLKTPFFITLLLSLLFQGGVVADVDNRSGAGTNGSYYDNILTLQSARIKPRKPKTGVLSIPYTRVDVLVKNGIAFTRFVQVYHNHGNTNQGYALNLPLKSDTVISAYNIWDRGKLYPGVIEDRRHAEAVYKKITGDEAPSMNKDPGLLRRTARRFEMRVFPIFPGENKQIEIFFFRRLPMKNGRFSLEFPLKEFTEARDARHGKVISLRTDISLALEDRLPFQDIQVDSRLKKVTGGDTPEFYRATYQTKGELAVAKNPVASFALNTGGKPASDTWTYSSGGESYFLTRLIDSAPEIRKMTLEAPDTGGRFYMGVWRSETQGQGSGEMEGILMLEPEILAYITLSMLNRGDFFYGAWSPPAMESRNKSKSPWAGTIVTPGRTYPVYQAKIALQEAMKSTRKRAKAKKQAAKSKASEAREKSEAKTSGDTGPDFTDIETHLRLSLKKEELSRVYLFLDKLKLEEYLRLREIIHGNQKTDFILVTFGVGAPPAYILKYKNVSYFDKTKGWVNLRFKKRAKQGRVLSPDNSELRGFLGMFHFSRFEDFWSALPNLDPLHPQIQIEGSPLIKEVFYSDGKTPRVFRRGRGRNSAEKKGAENEKIVPRLLWLSGRFSGEGPVAFKLVGSKYPLGFETMMRGTPEKKIFAVSLAKVNTKLELTRESTRDRYKYVGAMYARHQAARKNFRRNFLDMILSRSAGRGGRQKIDPLKRERYLRERLRLRAESVALSRRFGFISSETAFIALPAEMRAKYKIKPGHMNEESTSGGPSMPGAGGGVPEPEEYMLLLAAVLTGIAFWYYRKRGIKAKVLSPEI